MILHARRLLASSSIVLAAFSVQVSAQEMEEVKVTFI